MVPEPRPRGAEVIKNVDGNEVFARLTHKVPDCRDDMTQPSLQLALAGLLARHPEGLWQQPISIFLSGYPAEPLPSGNSSEG